jgi:hypothetical protein
LGVFGVYAFALLILMGQKARYVDLVNQVLQKRKVKEVQL